MLLLSVPYVPFTVALALLLAFLVLEIAALMLGGSLIGDSDADLDLDPEFDALVADFDLDADAMPDVAELIDTSETLQGITDSASGTSGATRGGIAGLLGLGRAPFMIWLATLLTGFGLSGLGIQSLADTLLGAPLSVAFASLGAALIGLAVTRHFTGLFARLLPSIETTATSAQFMGGLRGVVSQGIAQRGSPAEVRLRDRHGNLHFPRCEPFADSDVIVEGTPVLTVRVRKGPGEWALRILPTA